MMGDDREYLCFDENNTNKTQFWHARKFRDSTSILQGGMYEDQRSGYFAGAFMGRKFKNPVNMEFEKSLEYLLDDLSATSGENSISSTPRLGSVTPSMGTSSCTSLDTIMGRESVDSQGNIRDGFMIDITISDNNHSRNKHRPRSDIFDFIQGSNPYVPRSSLPITKTRSLCDVTHKPSKSKRRITSAREAKIYEKEFESVLDDLQSTITDLDSFSRETLGESAESLNMSTSVESISSLTTSEQVSSISDEVCSQSHDVSSVSEEVTSNTSENTSHTSSHAICDDSSVTSGDITKGSYHHRGTNKSYGNLIPHDTSNHAYFNQSYGCTNVRRSQNGRIASQQMDLSNGNDIVDISKYKIIAYNSNTQSERINNNVYKDQKYIHPNCHIDNEKCQNKMMQNRKYDTNHIENINETADIKLHNYSKFSSTGTTASQSSCVSKSHDISQSSFKSHDKVSDKSYILARHVSKQEPNAISNSTSTALDKSIESVMSSVTDLSVIGSEIGYIADMDEAILETPKSKWLDSNVINLDKETGVGDCFAPQGFRPLNFVGMESKYMIPPFKGNNLRIPTPVKLRKEISTQTSSVNEPGKNEDVIGGNINKEKENTSVSTQTEGSEIGLCNCKNNKSKKTPPTNKNTLINYSKNTSILLRNKNTRMLSNNSVTTSIQQNSLITNALSSNDNSDGEKAPLQFNQQQNNFLRVSDNRKETRKKRRISYCSSVDISPVLNGSVLYDVIQLHRAQSAESLLLSGHNKERIYNPVRRSDSNYHNTNELLKSAIEKKVLVKRPAIVVTVHSLHYSDKASQYISCQLNDGLLKAGDYRDNYMSSKLTNKNRSKSLPNIPYSNSVEQDVRQDQRLRKYASTLIISNVNRYLLSKSTAQQCGIKRTSYSQDINVNSLSSSHKPSLPPLLYRGAKCSVIKQSYSPSVAMNDVKCDTQRLKPLTTGRDVMTYTC